jgi:hypothetical protein
MDHNWKNLDLKRPPFMDGIGHIRLKLRSHTCGNEFQTMRVLEASPRRRCPHHPKLKWIGVEEATWDLCKQLLFFKVLLL